MKEKLIATSTSRSIRTTVGIPLHGSGLWIENVRQNILEMLEVAHVCVSDATKSDDTLARLEREFDGHERVSFIGKRALERGWVAHCNDLKARAQTQFFMWLPHDDLVRRGWVVSGEEALDANPAATLAVGSLRLVAKGTDDEVLHPNSDDAHADRAHRIREALTRQFATRYPGFGHAFRSVQRQSLTTLMPEDTARYSRGQSGWKADVLWAVRQLAIGPFAPMDEEYVKQILSDSASASWRQENLTSGFRRAMLDHSPGLTAEEREEILFALWEAEAISLRRGLGQRRNARHGD